MPLKKGPKVVLTVNLRSGIVGVAPLLLLIMALFAATSSSAETGGATPSITGCRGDALRGVFAQVAGSEGMGHVEFTLRLTNISNGTCTVAARPSLQLIGRAGERLPTHVSPWQPGTAASPVALRPRTTAFAAALVAVDIPGPGDSHRKGGPCQPSAVELRVAMADKTSTLAGVQPPTSDGNACLHGLGRAKLG